MKQSDLGLDLSNRRSRKQVFLDEMELVVPWQEFLALIVPHAPVKATGRKPFPIEAMLRNNFMDQWFPYSASRRPASIPERRSTNSGCIRELAVRLSLAYLGI